MLVEEVLLEEDADGSSELPEEVLVELLADGPTELDDILLELADDEGCTEPVEN